MGINNFCKLLNCVLPPDADFKPFDAILIDVQSFLYVAVHYSFETQEEEFIREICEYVFRQVRDALIFLLTSGRADPKSVTVVLSFDGSGVPMKWPTQRERRVGDVKGKRLVQISLFGVNKISTRVQEYVARAADNIRVPGVDTIRYVVCGCNVPGEGEHKMFQLAERLGTIRNPVVISVDQDVFPIAMARLDRYESIQIHRYKNVYHLSRDSFASSDYPWERFRILSFLFGNDFVPAVVGISDVNGPKIHSAILGSDGDESPPLVVAEFLNKLPLRYDEVAYVDPDLLVQFWKVYLWMEDYYRNRDFDQKYMRNEIYDAFDRNALLTGLAIAAFSTEAYETARATYADTVTRNPKRHLAHVIRDEALLQRLRRHWVTDEETGRDMCCTIVTVSKRGRWR